LSGGDVIIAAIDVFPVARKASDAQSADEAGCIRVPHLKKSVAIGIRCAAIEKRSGVKLR
jgi:hypothetical protein